MTDETTRERVGDYELLDLIGDGAQGRVYKAQYAGEDESKVARGEVVAIKLIRVTGDDDKLRTKFQAQADILRRLSHTNIVRYRDSFAWHAAEWDEAQCLVMEFLEGESLADRLKKASTGLPWPQVEQIFEQCLAGLIHARERGITHRDLKPSNIFLNKDGQAKVIDFDIARRDDSGQMSTAGWKGTFDYMAPDFIAINGFRGDEVSDVFSLGVCFYQALTGNLPYEPLGDSAHIGYLNRWRDGGAPAPSFRPGVFRVMSNAKPFVAKCLAAKREQRYQTFAAMLEDFRKIRPRRIRHKGKDEYELLGVLGRGGFGEVFKARRISDGALVAVKHLFAEKQSDRFIKEAKILQQYSHENLVKYVDFMVVEGTAGEKQYFLVLEFLEGMPGWTLRTRLKNEGRLEAQEAMPLFIGYLSALQFLHENSRPIIHRDIKPGNLYAPAGQPEKGKIFDLGVARDVSGTVTVGGVPGTLDYMPPEFADTGGDRGSPQSDIYALGLCLYESLAGRPVYERLPTDMNSAWLAFQKRLQKPVELSFEGQAFRQHPRLKKVILKALAPRPVDRYRRAADMRKEMEDILAGVADPELAGDSAMAEMTVATLHSFSEENGIHPPEPGATLGTRPLEGMGGTLPAPIDLVQAGRDEANRRRRRKQAVLIGSIAAGVILVVSVIAWIAMAISRRNADVLAQSMDQALQAVEQAAGGLANPVPTADYARALSQAYAEAVKTGQRYPQLAGRVDEQRRLMRKAGAALPAEFRRSFDAALSADKPEKADSILKEWQKVSAYADIMGLSARDYADRGDAMKGALARSQIEQELVSLREQIPDSVQDEAAADRADRLAIQLKTLQDKPWPGFDEQEKQRQVRALEDLVARRAKPLLDQLRDAALMRYKAGQDGSAERDALARFGDRHPGLARILQPAYLDAKNSVEAALQSRVSGGLRKVLELVSAARDTEGVKAAAGELASLEHQPGIRLLPADVKSAEDTIAAKYRFLADGLVQQAKSAFDAGQLAEGAKSQAALSALVSTAQDRFGKTALAQLAREVEARRVAAVDRQDLAAAARRKEARDAGAALDDLQARIAKGSLTACADGVTILAGIPEAVLADGELKGRRDAVVADYVKLIERALEQKDPLDQRPQRLKAADDILNAAAADRILTAAVKPLRESLAARKAAFLLRVNNQAGQPVRVSGQELKDKLMLAKDEVREIGVPVRAANSVASFLIEANGSKPRIETVVLVGGGGQELVLGALENEPVPAPTPGQSQALAAVTLVPSPGKGVLDIRVSPRGASLMVDGNMVRPGAIEVTPDENHKVTVQAPDFKPFLQHYRVKAGDVRKVEIFLEKAPRKTLFGL